MRLRKTSVAACVLTMSVWGCAKTKPVEPPPPPPAPAPLPVSELAEPDPGAELRAEVERLNQALAASEQQRAELARALVENNQELVALDEANRSLELELTSALEELLRAQASVRNVQSRAFAVSRIAEVRVELQTVRATKHRLVRDRLARAEDFLTRADAALSEGNVGGAAYLAERANELVRQANTVAELRRDASGEIIPIVPSRAIEVLTAANLRRGPSTDHERVGRVAPGETVNAVGRQGDWYQVEVPDGSKAWIHRRLLRTQ